MKTTVGNLKHLIRESFMDAKFESYCNRLYDVINQAANAMLPEQEIEDQLAALAKVTAIQMGVPEDAARNVVNSLYGSIDRGRDRATDVHSAALELHQAANPAPVREAAELDDVGAMVDAAAAAVEADIAAKPVTSRDGVWRFDRVLEGVFGRSKRPKEFWLRVERAARQLSQGSWTPYDIVASFAQTRGAWATPGFADAMHAKKYA